MNETLRELFERQHGVASDRQLRASGVSARLQAGHMRRGTWLRPVPWCVVVAGSTATWEQRAMVATLMTGAMLSGRPAAKLHRLDGFQDCDDVEVVIPHTARTPRQAPFTVRRSRRLSDKDRHVIDAIAVTILPVTLVHLCADGLNAAKALNGALRDGHSPRWLRENFARWQGYGARGATPVLRLLEERVEGRLPRSWFQRLAKRLLAADGIRLVDEYAIRDSRGRLVAECDLAHVELKVGVECQSWRHHGSPDAQRRDVARKRTFRRLGWEIVEVWWSDLNRMDDVLADLRIVLEDRRRLSTG